VSQFSLLFVAAQVRSIPLDRLLLESDAPDGAVRPGDAWAAALPALRQEPFLQRLAAVGDGHNTPASVACMLAVVATARGQEEEEVAKATRENAERVFISHFDEFQMEGAEVDPGPPP
jgi:Tat protein secretion system quality control protein TatD with DNase activity